MKAVRIHQYGGAEELKYENAPIPTIGDDELLVKVYATSVNHLEIKKAEGVFKGHSDLEFPWIPGYDFSGTIENIGADVSGFEVGDKVYGNCNGGSYAEYVAVSPFTTVKMPENLTFIEAASVPHVAETAWQAVHEHGQLKEGEKVLIHGAAGAVGAYATQFACKTGAIVYASVSAKDKAYVESLGAQVVIDYKTEDFTQIAKDMDLVIDLVGGDTQRKSYSVLKEGGRLVSTTGGILEEEAQNHQVTGIAMVIRQSAEDLKAITEMFKKNELKTDVQLTYFLPDAADGWKIMLGTDPNLPALSHGKIVLQVVQEEGKASGSMIGDCDQCY